MGAACRSAASRSHGSSARKRSATSYVAPPHASIDQQLRGQPGHVAGDREQVAGADPGGEQALVGVAERRVGDRDPLLLAQRRREPLGPEPEQLLARAVGCRHGEVERSAA